MIKPNIKSDLSFEYINIIQYEIYDRLKIKVTVIKLHGRWFYC